MQILKGYILKYFLFIFFFRFSSTVDIGVQTESSCFRRTSRKSFSPNKIALKRKLTTEIETQTNLTNNSRRKSRKKLYLGSKSSRHSSNHQQPSSKLSCNLAAQCSSVECSALIKDSSRNNVACSHRRDVEVGTDSSFSDWAECDFSQVFTNSFGTQTLPLQASSSSSSSTECDLISFGFLSRDESSKEKDFSSNKMPISDPLIVPARNSNFLPRPCYSEELDGDYFSENKISGEVSEKGVSQSCNRSGNVQDVFLCSSAGTSDDMNEDSICVETQTDWISSSAAYDPSMCCSSETQTYENFSDIEPYLCCDMDTQTVDGDNSSSVLFPELHNFARDIQTQTGFHDRDIISKVTAETQTLL